MNASSGKRDNWWGGNAFGAEKTLKDGATTRVPGRTERTRMMVMSHVSVSTSPLPSPAPPASIAAYDLGAWFYDWVVGSRLYHQWVWGMSPSEHSEFARHALEHSADGATLDAGCGSLLFTARCYHESPRRLTLLDASSGMLARARRRLDPHEAEWVQGDLRALPFEAEHFANVFHFGVLHCISETARVLSELARVTRPGGKLFLSCLVLGRSRGDAFLRRLERARHVAEPRRAEHYVIAIEQAGFTLRTQRLRGSFLFVEAERTR
jgi:SAM-dependent methyltransferase